MRVLWISLGVIALDQITKVLIKGSELLGITGMRLGESIPVFGDWFRITFTENPGMAFGMQFGPKLFTTIFAVVATILIFVYLWHVRKSHWGYRTCLAMILGGAVGNIIDRVFYARIYGYGDLFQGEVVDFIHFNIWQGTAAEWIPFFGGQWIALFPVWNVADMSIVIGVMVILVFQGFFHRADEKRKASDASVGNEVESMPTPDTNLDDSPSPESDAQQNEVVENEIPVPQVAESSDLEDKDNFH